MKSRPIAQDDSDETPRKRRRVMTPASGADFVNLQGHEHAQGLLENAARDASSAEESVAPFLARHIRDQYSPTTFNETGQSSFEQSVPKTTDNHHNDALKGGDRSVINDLIRIDFLAILPNEISFQILSYLDTASLCKAAQVSRAWKELADDDVVWHRMCEQHIDRKCKKCGWGLPLLERKRLRDSKKAMESRASEERQFRKDNDKQRRIRERQLATAEAEKTTLDFTPSAPTLDQTVSGTSSSYPAVTPPSRVPRPTSIGEVARCTDGEYFKCRYRPWKDVYRDRFKVGINWKHGRYTTRVYKGHTNAVMCLQFCDVANVLATGSYDATIKIWNLETGEEMRTLRGHTAGIRCLQFDERKLISGSLDRCIKVWNWRTGDCISTFTGHQGGVLSLHFDSTILLSGSMDSTVKIWNFEDRSVRNLKGHTDWVNSVRVDTPSRTVFTASDDLTAKLWDLDTGSVIQTFVGHVGQVQQVLPLPREFEFEEHDAECNNVNNNDDSRSVASNGSNHSHMSHGSAANLAAASPEYAAVFLRYCCCSASENRPPRPEPPRYILTAALDSIMRLWHVPTGRCLRTFFGHIEGIWAMSADTLRLISGSEDQTAKVWDPRTGMCERTFTGHTGPVTCVGLSDERFATGSEDSESPQHVKIVLNSSGKGQSKEEKAFRQNSDPAYHRQRSALRGTCTILRQTAAPENFDKMIHKASTKSSIDVTQCLNKRTIVSRPPCLTSRSCLPPTTTL
ncbi:hypothetical protein KEM54_003817 [Ascosphaera aggregata]|nr:hypothetical protein KEM54_003817 [Ascosphaera aggregata]